MKTSIFKALFIISLFTVGGICAQTNNVAVDNYWSQGKAEVNVYEVSQNRYQENHSGQLVSVFVTEDFFDKIYGPAGINIGAETPQEIAISILGEILSVIRNQKPIYLKDKQIGIHQ